MVSAARVPAALVLGGLAWAGFHWAAHRFVTGATPADGHGLHRTAASEAAVPAYLTTSLALCLALALLVAGAAALRGRRASRPGRALWLFGIVPALGLGGELLAGPLAHEAALAELGPAVLIVLGDQAAVAVVALRVAHGIFQLAASLAWALAAGGSPVPRAGRVLLSSARSDRAPASRRLSGGGQRAPPSLLLA